MVASPTELTFKNTAIFHWTPWISERKSITNQSERDNDTVFTDILHQFLDTILVLLPKASPLFSLEVKGTIEPQSLQLRSDKRSFLSRETSKDVSSGQLGPLVG